MPCHGVRCAERTGWTGKGVSLGGGAAGGRSAGLPHLCAGGLPRGSRRFRGRSDPDRRRGRSFRGAADVCSLRRGGGSGHHDAGGASLRRVRHMSRVRRADESAKPLGGGRDLPDPGVDGRRAGGDRRVRARRARGAAAGIGGAGRNRDAGD